MGCVVEGPPEAVGCSIHAAMSITDSVEADCSPPCFLCPFVLPARQATLFVDTHRCCCFWNVRCKLPRQRSKVARSAFKRSRGMREVPPLAGCRERDYTCSRWACRSEEIPKWAPFQLPGLLSTNLATPIGSCRCSRLLVAGVSLSCHSKLPGCCIALLCCSVKHGAAGRCHQPAGENVNDGVICF